MQVCLKIKVGERSICHWTQFGILIDMKCKGFLNLAKLSFLALFIWRLQWLKDSGIQYIYLLFSYESFPAQLSFQGDWCTSLYMPSLRSFSQLCAALLWRNRVKCTQSMLAPTWWDAEMGRRPLPSPLEHWNHQEHGAWICVISATAQLYCTGLPKQGMEIHGHCCNSVQKPVMRYLAFLEADTYFLSAAL